MIADCGSEQTENPDNLGLPEQHENPVKIAKFHETTSRCFSCSVVTHVYAYPVCYSGMGYLAFTKEVWISIYSSSRNIKLAKGHCT